MDGYQSQLRYQTTGAVAVDPRFFHDFLVSGDSLRIYRGQELIFGSNQDRPAPLMTYLDHFTSEPSPVIFSKITGNADALLAVKAGCRELFSPYASQPAVATLTKYGVKYHLGEVVPAILQPGSNEVCPMERLSLGKEPEAFYRLMKETAPGQS